VSAEYQGHNAAFSLKTMAHQQQYAPAMREPPITGTMLPFSKPAAWINSCPKS
jgi:hypothetical protein